MTIISTYHVASEIWHGCFIIHSQHGLNNHLLPTFAAMHNNFIRILINSICCFFLLQNPAGLTRLWWQFAYYSFICLLFLSTCNIRLHTMQVNNIRDIFNNKFKLKLYIYYCRILIYILIMWLIVSFILGRFALY